MTTGVDRSVTQLLGRVADLRVVVVGDALLDRWLFGGAVRVARESAVPVVEVDRTEPAPGGAANCAANASRLGAQVSYLGIVGTDSAGVQVRCALESHGIDCRGVVDDPTGTTCTKHRLVANDQVVSRFDTGAPGWSADARADLTARFLRAAQDADLVLLADYGGALDERFVRALEESRGRIRAPLVVDGHDFARWRNCRPTAMTPSLDEALTLAGLSPGRATQDGPNEQSGRLLAASRTALLVTTLDSAGAVLHRRGLPPHRTIASPGNPSHACGAGDTFTTVFGLALAAGVEPAAATDLAQRAADVVMRRPGTSTCSAEELRLECARGTCIPPDVLAGIVQQHRAAGRRIVFTNGCFDVLHLGHLRYLQEARAYGDVLIVAVNSDRSVRELKGPGRPIVPDVERAALVAGLQPVDLVTVFDEPTPVSLLELVRPDVYVKGGDYTPEMLPEAPVVQALGGRVVTVGYLPEHSTTDLLQRIGTTAPVPEGRG